MNIFKIAGKFLDQPILVAKFKKSVPLLLTTSGSAYTAYRIKETKKGERKKTALRVGTTMAITVMSALAAPKITNKIFKNKTLNLQETIQKNTNLINEYLNKTQVSEKTQTILNKARNKVLSFKEIKTLYKDPQKDCAFLNKLNPEPENISSKEIFSEIGRLSLLGLIPVLGGICGGIIGDNISGEKLKEKIPNKLKEGAYQYLANIFLCNIGAGAALALMEKCGVKAKKSRALGMIGGITATGIIGGSAIANIIGNKLINPIFGTKNNKKLYSERTPEALDIGLHVDDIATVAVMSGLKWIEPALPIMYAVSGYRAGIGYRNVNNCNEKKDL